MSWACVPVIMQEGDGGKMGGGARARMPEIGGPRLRLQRRDQAGEVAYAAFLAHRQNHGHDRDKTYGCEILARGSKPRFGNSQTFAASEPRLPKVPACSRRDPRGRRGESRPWRRRRRHAFSTTTDWPRSSPMRLATIRASIVRRASGLVAAATTSVIDRFGKLLGRGSVRGQNNSAAIAAITDLIIVSPADA